MATRRDSYADDRYADDRYARDDAPRVESGYPEGARRDDPYLEDGYRDVPRERGASAGAYADGRYEDDRYEDHRYADDAYGEGYPDDMHADADHRAPMAAAPRRRFLPVAGSILVLGLFGGAIWYAYQAGVNAGSDSGVPLIVAEDTPVKVRPADPGGLEVPHQNVLVYNRLQPQQNRNAPEQLLPPAEQPIPRSAIPPVGNLAPELPPAVPSPAAPGPAVPNEAELMAEGTTGPVEGEEEADVTTAPAEPARPAEVAKPAAPVPPPAAPVQTAMVPPTAPPATPPKTTPSGSGYRVQLASLRSEADAREVWERLQKTQPGLLGKLQAQVVRTDLGPGRGVYYRLQAGPLSEKTLADMLCGELRSRRLDCLIVQP